MKTKEVKTKRKPFKRGFAIPGRNEPCPCKSGKKWKDCCGSAVQDKMKEKIIARNHKKK